MGEEVSLRDRLKKQLTRERLSFVARFVKRRALEMAGRAFLAKYGGEHDMKRYTLQVTVAVDAESKEVIEDAIGSAGAQVQGHASDALSFFNLDGHAKFSGFNFSVRARRKVKGEGQMKTFVVQVNLFLMATGKAILQEPVSTVMQGRVSEYAPIVLEFLGLADKVHFREMSADVVRGHTT